MATGKVDDFTARMFAAINDMMLDMLAACARKDYEDRRRRRMQGQGKGRRQVCRRPREQAPQCPYRRHVGRRHVVQRCTGGNRVQPCDGRQDRQARRGCVGAGQRKPRPSCGPYRARPSRPGFSFGRARQQNGRIPAALGELQSGVLCNLGNLLKSDSRDDKNFGGFRNTGLVGGASFLRPTTPAARRATTPLLGHIRDVAAVIRSPCRRALAALSAGRARGHPASRRETVSG
jgi:hypothetical protein